MFEQIGLNLNYKQGLCPCICLGSISVERVNERIIELEILTRQFKIKTKRKSYKS